MRAFHSFLVLSSAAFLALTNAITLHRICKKENQTSLTFDMGPIKTVTGAILDVLKAKGVRATFHVTPTFVADDVQVQSLVARIVSEGHLLGYAVDQTSQYLTYSDPQIVDYFAKAVTLIKSYGGRTPKFVRLVYESYNERIIRALTFTGFYPTGFFDSYDYKFTDNPDELLSFLNSTYGGKNGLKSRRIFKFMDTPQTAASIGVFIDLLQGLNLKIVALDTCLNEDSYYTGSLNGPYQFNDDEGKQVNVDTNSTTPITTQTPGPSPKGSTSAGSEGNYSSAIILMSTLLAIIFQWL